MLRATPGCSQPTKPAPKWAGPIPSHPKSHNHNELTAKFGVFSIAEEATYEVWIMDQRARVQVTIAKTKSELKRLDSALLRLEHAVHSMGRHDSPRLPGWFGR
jgi:hypothetical protein